MNWKKVKEERPEQSGSVLLALSNLTVVEAKYVIWDLYTVESYNKSLYYSCNENDKLDDRINVDNIEPMFWCEMPIHPLLENY